MKRLKHANHGINEEGEWVVHQTSRRKKKKNNNNNKNKNKKKVKKETGPAYLTLPLDCYEPLYFFCFRFVAMP